MKLFKEVNCLGYLQKIRDGRFIETQIHNGRILSCKFVDSNFPNSSVDCEEEETMLKTYYKYREKSFKGFVVGIKDIVTTGNLTAYSVDAPFDDYAYRIEKKPLEVVKCAIVYFGNNRKRFVPLDKILEVE